MTILVTGSSGKTSSRLATLLHSANNKFLIASRSGTSSQNSNFPAVRFEWRDPSTYANPFTHPLAQTEPISAIYLVSPVPGGSDSEKWIKAFIDFARGKGVKRFVYLSSSAVDDESPMFGGVHRYLKELEKSEGLEWAILKPSWFMENFSEATQMTDIRSQSKIYTATGNGKVPFISCRDIATVAHAALTSSTPPNTEYLLLGPELFSYGEVAEIFTEVLGRRVEHINLTPEEREEQLHKFGGLPEDFARVLTGLEVGISRGLEERVNDVVREVTGKEPVRLRDFVEANKRVWIE